MKPSRLTPYLVLAAIMMAPGSLHAQEILVQDSAQLRSAIRKLRPGDTLLIASGEYSGAIYLGKVSGTETAPITIRGADPDNTPVFTRGSQAFHFANCSYLTVSNLKVKGFPSNGINIDDGGSFETPAHHITLENLTIRETGPRGNHDALKMSGVDHFVVRGCHFEAWGGSGIDMVGCHHGIVEDCTFVGREGFSQSNAVQLKGGTRYIVVRTSFFKNAGQRAINLGGSTGLQFFRPKVGDYEAKEITVAGNRFVGGITPLAWVTADGGHVHHNTIVLPGKWILRILQETKDPQFRPCHGGVFENNLIIYDSKVQVFVNIGPRTAPETFTFRRNAWHDLDGARKPNLPTRETAGIHQVRIDTSKATLAEGRVQPKDGRLNTIGAAGYKPLK